jgi:hypothetical protein
MVSFHVRDNGAVAASRRLRAIIVLSLPTIVGTGFFLCTALFSRVGEPHGAVFDPWREETGLARLGPGVAAVIFVVCYFGAAAGPLLLPLAGQQALSLTRTVGMRSSDAIWAWTFVAVGIAATGLFWGGLINLDIFI